MLLVFVYYTLLVTTIVFFALSLFFRLSNAKASLVLSLIGVGLALLSFVVQFFVGSGNMYWTFVYFNVFLFFLIFKSIKL